MRFVLVGGGNSTHCLLPLLCRKNIGVTSVTVWTRRPEKWSTKVSVRNDDREWCASEELVCQTPFTVTADVECMRDADVVWIAGIPVHHNRDILRKISSHVAKDRTVHIGSICGYGGFDWLVKECMPKNCVPFATHLIPWCCGTLQYGKRGVIFGAKRVLRIATPDGRDRFGVKKILEPILMQKLIDLDFLSSTLWPNNASLHPPILYGLFSNWDGTTPFPNDSIPQRIYAELSDASALALKELDDDIVRIVEALSKRFPENEYLKLPFDLKSNILTNYEKQVSDSSTLASTVRTNSAFAKHNIPYTKVDETHSVPTLDHKFFLTDVPYGLIIYKQFSDYMGLKTPALDKILIWNQNIAGKSYYVRGRGFAGKDMDEAVRIPDELRKQLQS